MPTVSLPYIIGFMIALNFATCVWSYSKGKESSEIVYVRKEVTIMEKRNEIARNRPDDKSFFNGLLNSSEW